ncbi:MAG: phytanoyl-CoA dioxygenase family protein, partial [Pseudomonadota bacterium]
PEDGTLMQPTCTYKTIEGAKAGREVSQMPGIGRLSGTVLKPMNADGLFDVFMTHPKLLAAVRHVLGVHFKMSSSNYHCPLPGFGHQALHADWGWGVPQPEVVNSIWMLDDFTDDNGPTRLVPRSHLSQQHPSGSAFNDGTRTLYDKAENEIYLTGQAGSCVVYNAHLWHGGTQNRSQGLRRSLHSFFTRSERPTQTDTISVLDPALHQRLTRTQRALLDIEAP